MAYMTQKGYDKLVAELQQLEAVERPKASAAIAEARDKGDLSENAEYDAAKEAQSLLEMKITQLKATIADAKMTYTIVSETEANLREGKISVKTPIAQGLLGRKVGDIVDIRVPQGMIQLEILHISYEE